jgi:hypothetical protein
MKELRIGLREKKVFFIQLIYLLTLGVISFIYLMEILNRHSHGGYYLYHLTESREWHI